MKIYSDFTYYKAENKASLAGILRLFADEKGVLPVEDKLFSLEFYGHKIVKRIDDADVCVLPMAWEYYYRSRSIKKAKAFISLARARNKKILSWTYGDEGCKPADKDVLVFQYGGYSRYNHSMQRITPVFFDDPLSLLKIPSIDIRDKHERPSVGFCGLARDNFIERTVKPPWRLLYNLKSYFGVSKRYPRALGSYHLLRAKALKIIAGSDKIDANFIVRQKYFSTLKEKAREDLLRKEFLDNIMQSDYVLSLRGSGNFSVRLYETLAMGRIPLFINTNCILPFENIINWRKHCIWVEYDDISHIESIIMDFHSSKSPSYFREL